MLTKNNASIVLLYDTACLLFPRFIESLFISINLLKSDVPFALKTRTAFQVAETLMRCAKELHIINYCFHKVNKFLIQNINLACDIHVFLISSVNLSMQYLFLANVYLSCAKFSSIYF